MKIRKEFKYMSTYKVYIGQNNRRPWEKKYLRNETWVLSLRNAHLRFKLKKTNNKSHCCAFNHLF